MLTIVLSSIVMNEPMVVTLRASQRGSILPKRPDVVVALIATPTPTPRRRSRPVVAAPAARPDSLTRNRYPPATTLPVAGVRS